MPLIMPVHGIHVVRVRIFFKKRFCCDEFTLFRIPCCKLFNEFLIYLAVCTNSSCKFRPRRITHVLFASHCLFSLVVMQSHR